MAQQSLTLGEKMRTLRLQMGLTQADLAGEEFTKSFISQIEKNQARPSLNSLRIFAQRLNRPISYFLDDDDGAPPTPSQSHRALSTGDLLERRGKYEEALHIYDQALAACGPTDYPVRGRIYRQRARSLIRLDRPQAAIQSLQLADEEFRLARDTNSRAAVDRALADTYFRLENFQAAIHHYERALLLYDDALAPHSDVDSTFSLVRLLTDLGLTCVLSGLTDAAGRHLQRAETLAAGAGIFYRWGELCAALSRIKQDQGDSRAATQYAHQAVAFFDATVNHEGLVEALAELGVLLATQRNRRAAEPYFERARDIAQRTDFAEGAGIVQAALAQLAHTEGDAQRAIKLYEEAIVTCKDERRCMHMRRALAELFRGQKEWDAAAEQFRAVAAYWEGRRCTKPLAATYSALAEVYESAGQHDNAADYFKRSVQLYEAG